MDNLRGQGCEVSFWIVKQSRQHASRYIADTKAARLECGQEAARTRSPAVLAHKALWHHVVEWKCSCCILGYETPTANLLIHPLDIVGPGRRRFTIHLSPCLSFPDS